MLTTIIDEVTMPTEINFLILEDNPDIRELLIEELRSLNFKGKFFEAKDLHQSQDIFNREEIHYCLLDWNLPDGTGVKFLNALRKFDEYNNVPVLLVTGSDKVDTVLDAMEAGASDYLTKPWISEELALKIALCWTKHN